MGLVLDCYNSHWGDWGGRIGLQQGRIAAKGLVASPIYSNTKAETQAKWSAANRMGTFNKPVRFHRAKGSVCARALVLVLLQLILVSVPKSNVSLAGLELVASEAQTTCQSLKCTHCLPARSVSVCVCVCVGAAWHGEMERRCIHGIGHRESEVCVAQTGATPICDSIRLLLAHLHANYFIPDDSGQNVKYHVNI